uniref:OAR domain-containing protein n=1 Tax=Timema douglasi TaxID=61478 RepID=A0A7R8VQN6_TIMDO|nr:unnamed protein product [Timema douglasi]
MRTYFTRHCEAFPGLCSCCPIKPVTSLGPWDQGADHRSSSVAELRRKAQEHSAALLQSLQHVASFQQQAAANFQHHLSSLPLGLNLPPLSTLQALARKSDNTATLPASPPGSPASNRDSQQS